MTSTAHRRETAMPNTARIIRKMATFIINDGLHTGTQFAIRSPLNRLDICAIAYVVAEDQPAPPEFFTDELASIRIIECSAGAMQAIRAISDGLDSAPSMDTLDRGVQVPNRIEHVSNWAATRAIGEKQRPTVSEVIGRLHRIADNLDATLPNAA